MASCLWNTRGRQTNILNICCISWGFCRGCPWDLGNCIVIMPMFVCDVVDLCVMFSLISWAAGEQNWFRWDHYMVPSFCAVVLLPEGNCRLSALQKRQVRLFCLIFLAGAVSRWCSCVWCQCLVGLAETMFGKSFGAWYYIASRCCSRRKRSHAQLWKDAGSRELYIYDQVHMNGPPEMGRHFWGHLPLAWMHELMLDFTLYYILFSNEEARDDANRLWVLVLKDTRRQRPHRWTWRQLTTNKVLVHKHVA